MLNMNIDAEHHLALASEYLREFVIGFRKDQASMKIQVFLGGETYICLDYFYIRHFSRSFYSHIRLPEKTFIELCQDKEPYDLLTHARSHLEQARSLLTTLAKHNNARLTMIAVVNTRTETYFVFAAYDAP